MLRPRRSAAHAAALGNGPTCLQACSHWVAFTGLGFVVLVALAAALAANAAPTSVAAVRACCACRAAILATSASYLAARRWARASSESGVVGSAAIAAPAMRHEPMMAAAISAIVVWQRMILRARDADKRVRTGDRQCSFAPVSGYCGLFFFGTHNSSTPPARTIQPATRGKATQKAAREPQPGCASLCGLPTRLFATWTAALLGLWGPVCPVTLLHADLPLLYASQALLRTADRQQRQRPCSGGDSAAAGPTSPIKSLRHVCGWADEKTIGPRAAPVHGQTPMCPLGGCEKHRSRWRQEACGAGLRAHCPRVARARILTTQMNLAATSLG